MPVVLSFVQARLLLEAKQSQQSTATISLDLGLTVVDAQIDAHEVTFPNREHLSWAVIEAINDSDTACFVVENGEAHKIQAFSDTTNRFCSLMPTSGAPTLLLAGFPMHRIKGTDPHRDTLSKIKACAPVTGNVLDTTTGLGYTAIEASKTANEVITIELDPAVLEVARQNPWSQLLFDNPKIHQEIGDSTEVIATFEDGAFHRIIHDPPTLALGGDLYSGAFYRELFRVLRRGGRLFHYIGDLDSQHGKRVSKGALRRLQEAGFANVRPFQAAFGLVAQKK
jgi:predicted methyltransferase